LREGIPLEGLIDDFHQPGIRWRSFDPERRQRFADRVAVSLSGFLTFSFFFLFCKSKLKLFFFETKGPRLGEEVRHVWLGFWNKVDPNLHKMILEFFFFFILFFIFF